MIEIRVKSSTEDDESGKKCAFNHYGSIAEFEDALLHNAWKNPENAKAADRYNTRSQGRTEWYGVNGLEEVKHIMRDGFTEGATLVDTTYDKLHDRLPRAIDFRRQLVRADQGDSLDIHAVNRGALDKAWTTVKRRARMGTGLIRIAVDVCCNANIGAEELRWRGIAALSLARVMQKAGYSVEIVAGLALRGSIQKGPLYSLQTIVVKPRNAAVDTATLAAALSPGFFRWLGFIGGVKNADDADCEVDAFLGQATALRSIIPTPDKVMQVCTPPINGEQAAIAWVIEAVKLFQMNTLATERAA